MYLTKIILSVRIKSSLKSSLGLFALVYLTIFKTDDTIHLIQRVRLELKLLTRIKVHKMTRSASDLQIVL